MTRFCAPRRHAVREALLGLQRPVLQQLCRQWPGVGIGNDLIVVAMHYQHRHCDLFEVVGESLSTNRQRPSRQPSVICMSLRLTNMGG